MPTQSASTVFKQYVPKHEAQAHSRTKRTRPKVPAEQRKRARLACETCRQKKDKCDGNVPCQRCARDGNLCIPGTASTHGRMSQTERVERLQLVVQHTLGIATLTDDDLRTISDSISSKAPSAWDESNPPVESSLSTFSRQLQQKLGDSRESNEENERADDAIAEFCRSPSPVITSTKRFLHSALAAQPSREIADRLSRVCFDKVQCNSFYAEESWVYEQLDRLYEAPSTLTEPDTPIVASLMMVMALGSQFSSDPTFESLGHVLCEQTTTIVPDLIKRSDFESLRACLLLATYLFPVDHSGKAYTYLGLALHIAMTRKMHQHCRDEVEVRVWWTLYTFYQRARIFHGHPPTLSHANVAVRRPRLCPKLEPANGISNFDNQITLIEITIILEHIADDM